jgi:hypothetical protein
MRHQRFDSSILQSRALVAVVCLAVAGACSGEDTGGEGTPTGAAGASGSGGSSGGGPAAPDFTSGGSAGTGAGGSAPVAAAAGGPGFVGSSGAPGAAGVAGATGAAGSDGGGGAAGAGGSDGGGGAAGAGGSDGDDGDDGDDGVNYTSDAQPILQANCSPCHSGLSLGGHNAASVYADAVRVAENMLDEIESGDMPPACDGDDPGDPNCVSEEDLEVLEQWVDDDTPE